MLLTISENIWLADGQVTHVGGFGYPTRMAVIRLADGGLFVWSPVALSKSLQAAVDALGECAISLHRTRTIISSLISGSKPIRPRSSTLRQGCGNGART